MPLFLVQPLMDNLEAQTYETFEKDVVKYTQVSAICCEYAFFLYIVYVLKELLSFHVYCKNIKQVWNFELNLLHLCFQIFPFLFNDQLYDFLWWYLPPSSINFLAWTDGPGLAKEKKHHMTRMLSFSFLGFTAFLLLLTPIILYLHHVHSIKEQLLRLWLIGSQMMRSPQLGR